MSFLKNKTKAQKKIIIPPDESYVPKLRVSQLKLNEFDEVMPQKTSIHEGVRNKITLLFTKNIYLSVFY